MKTFNLDLSKDAFQEVSHNPETYILNENLAAAVEVAVALGQPLLLTGEPGTGKTRLAYKIAWDLSKKHEDFLPEPLVFHTKTSSKSQDLFYHYDALRHFHDAHIQKASGNEAPESSAYIQLKAMGKALALTQQKEIESQKFIQEKSCKSSVVLIDEIDKAPRDFPNDILYEIENNSFEIPEANNHRISKGNKHRIIVILSSNSEKNLPEPFLRRCIFYHIPFPKQEELIAIAVSQLGKQSKYSDKVLIEHFQEIRHKVKKKKPATAELISWLRILELQDFLKGGLNFKRLSPRQKQILRLSYSVLAKNKEDLSRLQSI